MHGADSEFTWRAVGICLVIGVACAVAGSIFALCIRLLQNTTMQIVRNYYLWVVVGGLIMATLVSVFGWWRLTGSGGEMLNHMLAQPNVSWDFAIKGCSPSSASVSGSKAVRSCRRCA